MIKSKFSYTEQKIDQVLDAIKKSLTHSRDLSAQNLNQITALLTSVNPRNILAMGYSVIKNADKKIVKSSDQLTVDSNFNAYFYKGSVGAKVIKKEV